MPENQRIKVIIDTNLWISFFIGKALVNLKELMVEQTIQIIFCEQILEEINLVTLKTKASEILSCNESPRLD